MLLEYLKPFIYGILFGIPFCLAVGPVFFLLIQAGVNRGVKYALAIACGVIMADTVLIGATYFFVVNIQDFVIHNYVIIQMLISFLLFIIGIFSIFKKEKEKVIELSKAGVFLFFINGFILDVFNPSNIFVWIGVNSRLIVYNNLQHLLFYLASLLTIALLMILLAILSNRVQQILTNKALRKINISLGLLYICFSLTIFLGGNYFRHLIS